MYYAPIESAQYKNLHICDMYEIQYATRKSLIVVVNRNIMRIIFFYCKGTKVLTEIEVKVNAFFSKWATLIIITI